MTIAQVDALLAESRALNMSGALEIDLAQVQEVDTVALSLIFEWLRHAEAGKATLTISSLPANLASLATMYGVLDLIPQASH